MSIRQDPGSRRAETIYTDVLFAANQERRARKLLRLILWIATLLALAWGAWVFNEFGLVPELAIHAIFTVLGFAVLRYESRIALRPLGHVMYWVGLAFIWLIQLTMEGISEPYTATVNLWFVALVMALWLVLHRERRVVLLLYSLVAFASFIVCEFALIKSQSVLGQDNDGAGLAGAITVVSVFITIVMLTRSWAREVHDAEWNLSVANNRLEELIENMLPKAISERLRREGKTFADGVAECSVLFVDVVGFTKLSASMPAEDLVRLLDEIFSKFDELTTELKLEKIKTIGDAYMVAAGLLEPRSDHALALVGLAVQIRATIREYGLHIRAGINSGNVVAGVIGRKRFIYDIWGDTVNVASRMESAGVVDEIQVTQSTADLIGSAYELTARGNITIKGKGEMPVYLVGNARARAADGRT